MRHTDSSGITSAPDPTWACLRLGVFQLSVGLWPPRILVCGRQTADLKVGSRCKKDSPVIRRLRDQGAISEYLSLVLYRYYLSS